MAIAYEDICIVPSSALLYELKQMELELPEIASGDRPVPMDVDNTTDSCPNRPLQNLNHLPKHLYGVTTHCQGP